MYPHMPDFLNIWWENLNFELQIFYGIAIVSLVALFFQVIMSVVFGMEHGADVPDVANHDSGMGIFSVRGVTAFFTGFGWTGVVCTKQDLGLLLAIVTVTAESAEVIPAARSAGLLQHLPNLMTIIGSFIHPEHSY